jgi:hypothetical protein
LRGFALVGFRPSMATLISLPNEEGHGATSLASVAKGVCLRHEKYPAP